MELFEEIWLFYQEWKRFFSLQRLLDSIKCVIQQEFEKFSLKSDGKGSKCEWNVFQSMCIQ